VGVIALPISNCRLPIGRIWELTVTLNLKVDLFFTTSKNRQLEIGIGNRRSKMTYG